MNFLKKVRLILREGNLYLSNYLISKIPFFLIRKVWYRHLLGIKIGRDSSIFMGAYFYTKGNFEMQNNSVINQNCRLDNRGGIFIGKNVSISAEVTILTADHDMRSPTFSGRVKGVRIEDYVFIGTRALILPGVTLEVGSAVGAGSVVVKSIPPYEIHAGVPARKIGMRPENLSYTLKHIRIFH
ncbi:MAG: acyltransferase [Cyanobacteriota bacterium]|nr:acyltransferase [Cyanobacteriota bacterium]